MREYAAPFFYGYKLPGLPSSLGRSFFLEKDAKGVEDGERILGLPTARAEFTDLSETEVWRAIRGEPDSSPITAEVARLAIEYLASFKAHFTKRGYSPPRRLRIEVRCPIEKVAALAVVKFIEAEAQAVCADTFH